MPRPTTVYTPMKRAETDEFARRLTKHMARVGMSQSDLARKIWGTITDTRGQTVARNRDRISHYVRGSQLPEPKTMHAIAVALGVEVADLNPTQALLAEANGRPETAVTTIMGQPGLAFVTINKVMPLRLAMQILAMITKSEEENKKVPREPTQEGLL